MHNEFITQWFDWDRPEPRKARWLNKVFRALGYSACVISPHRTGETSTVEQRMNIFHLLTAVLNFQVPGDVIEIGVHAGKTAALLQRILQDEKCDRQLHLFDRFDDPPVRVLRENFRQVRLPMPQIHVGSICDTMPKSGIGQICFAHIDLGPGGGPAQHESAVDCSIEFVYPRLAPGGVCLIADYCDPELYSKPGQHFPRCIPFTQWWGIYPHVKRATDRFLADKPETISILYGGEYSHAYFRKLGHDGIT